MVNENVSSSSTADKEAEMKSSSLELIAARNSAAFGRVKRVLAPIILRRTKDTLSEDGTPILTLPPIDASVVNVVLSPAEREFYNARKNPTIDCLLHSLASSFLEQYFV